MLFGDMPDARRDTVVVVSVMHDGDGILGRVTYDGPDGEPVVEQRKSIDELCDLVRQTLQQWQMRA
jgi:CTP:molybdopterin cytidylyltransferase MocA